MQYFNHILYQLHLAGMGEYAIRDLNDKINKLMREKRHWERQIKAIGGPNYTKHRQTFDAEGKTVPGDDGEYRYINYISIFCYTVLF